MTNRHVLPSADVARHSLAEFDYEQDEHFVETTPRVFNFLPSDIYLSHANLDVAFVAVANFAHDGTPLAEFGSLPLLQRSGKAINGEWVTLIQHPNGEPKQIVIRESQIVRLASHSNLKNDMIAYTSDTEPGSSGAPVLNDDFQVVALHQRAIPAVNENGQILNRDGEVWDEGQGEDARKWVGNAGIRISAILTAVRASAASETMAKAVVARFNAGYLQTRSPAAASSPLKPIDTATTAAPFESTRFDGMAGYDPDFHGVPIPLPNIVDEDLGAVTPRKDGTGHVLNYTHFSVVMNQARRLAYFTAVNIDGSSFGKPSDGVGGSWRSDRRIEFREQSNNELYKDDDSEPRHLDRGHLVRRLDPAWGTEDEIDQAVEDTYHWTNAAPQEHGYNDQIWGNLEDLLLMRAAKNDKKMSVFSGPIFGVFDRIYGEKRKHGPYLIPEAFWKVVVFTRDDGQLSATGYILKQTERIDALFESDLFRGFNPFTVGQAGTFQEPIELVEELTHLDFGGLKTHDPIAGLESTFGRRRISNARDVSV